MNIENGMKLAKAVFDMYSKEVERTGNPDMSEYIVTNRLYRTVHEFVSKDLDLDKYYPFDLIDMDDEQMYGEFNGHTVSMNSNLLPTSCFVYAYKQQDKDILDESLYILSTMAHELRHAWQRETGQYAQYVDCYVDEEAYLKSEAEVDARQYQASIYGKGLYKTLMEEVN